MRRLIVVEYERCSLMRTEPQGVSPEKRSRHIYYMEDNQLHAIIVKLSYYMYFHVVTKSSSYTLSSIIHTFSTYIEHTCRDQ